MQTAVLHIRMETGRMSAIESIRSYELDLKRDPHFEDPRRLLRYSFQVNSQNEEDGMIREIFRRIGTADRTFAEVGVGDGTENNTAFLLSQGWKGFWVDGSDAFLKAIDGRDDLADGCLKHCVAWVEKENIAEFFERLGVPVGLDLLSLDIDQNTYYIWEALNGYAPRVVVVEYNAGVPPDLDWKVRYDPKRAWDGTQNFGASLKAFEKLGARLGYSLVGCDFTGTNAFFVRSDLAADKFAAPYTAENHYQPPRYHYVHRRGHPRAVLDRQGPAPAER